MSSNFDKWGDAVFQFGKEASDAVKKVASEAKEAVDKKSKELDLKNKYAELGKAYFNAHKNDSIYEYDVMVDIINLEQEIENL